MSKTEKISVRPYKEEDEEAVRSLHELSFPFPDLKNPMYFVKDVIEKDGKIIALGTARLTCEGIAILDPKLSDEEKTEAIKLLLALALMKCQKFGLYDLHAFLAGPHAESFREILKKHFGFEDCEGLPLVLRF